MSELRVLVIDDNPGDVELLKEGFSEAGIPIELLVAENAVQAYTWMRDLAETEAPDLILIDLNLPIIKGQAILKELRDHRPWWKARAVVLSSSSAKHEVSECMKFGAAECLVKPTRFEDYIELARYLLRSCRPGAPPSEGSKRIAVEHVAATPRVPRTSGSSRARTAR